MSKKVRIVTIFGSSHPVEGDEEYRIAYDTGRNLALAGFTVCNGGYGGIMEASAKGAKEAGGKTIGVTFKNSFRNNANQWIDENIFQLTLIERLMKLIELGSAYVILKGGTGTLLEFAAVWEFINKQLLAEKPIVMIGNFWFDLINILRGEVLREGINDCTRFIYNASSPEECVSYLGKKLT